MKSKAPKKVSRKAKVILSPEWKEAIEVIDERSSRRTGVLYEQFQERVSAVAEQYTSLHGKLDSVVEAVGEIKEDVEIIKSNIEILKSGIRIKVDYQDFEALEKRVRLVETKLRR